MGFPELIFSTNDSSMSNNSKSVPAVSSVEGAGRVVDGGDVSSEGLGLGGGPVLTLERLGHGLVGHLASSTVDRGGVDSMVGNRVGKSVASVGNYWSGMGNSMGNWVSNMGSHGNNSSVSDGDWPVGSDGRLDLREALGVVSLSD